MTSENFTDPMRTRDNLFHVWRLLAMACRVAPRGPDDSHLLTVRLSIFAIDPNRDAESFVMPQKIFFSWQSDRPAIAGRNLIERALERAVKRIGDDTTIEEALRDLSVDRDTKGVPGSPPIVDTIFDKILEAAVFVADLTFVGRRPDRRPIPNANVLIEYGRSGEMSTSAPWLMPAPLRHRCRVSAEDADLGEAVSDPTYRAPSGAAWVIQPCRWTVCNLRGDSTVPASPAVRSLK